MENNKKHVPDYEISTRMQFSYVTKDDKDIDINADIAFFREQVNIPEQSKGAKDESSGTNK